MVFKQFNAMLLASTPLKYKAYESTVNRKTVKNITLFLKVSFCTYMFWKSLLIAVFYSI